MVVLPGLCGSIEAVSRRSSRRHLMSANQERNKDGQDQTDSSVAN
jgi:hypothetical protein